jgi:hypothetical protein
MFLPVAVVPEPGAAPVLPRTPETIEIEFGGGVRMRIIGAIDASIIKGMVGALAKIRPAMIPVPSGVQVWLASGHTDMRKGFDGLALLGQETLKRNHIPHSFHAQPVRQN